MSAIVVGIGNLSRGDDAVGPLVAARVARLGLPDVEVVVHDEPLALLEHLATHEDVVVVDAATVRRGRPGTVHVVQVGSTPLPIDSPASGSHGLGVAEAIELARALCRLPKRLTLVGVEGEVFAVGAPLTERVRACLDDAVRAVVGTLPASAC